jgi:hypothetical protein
LLIQRRERPFAENLGAIHQRVVGEAVRSQRLLRLATQRIARNCTVLVEDYFLGAVFALGPLDLGDGRKNQDLPGETFAFLHHVDQAAGDVVVVPPRQRQNDCRVAVAHVGRHACDLDLVAKLSHVELHVAADRGVEFFKIGVGLLVEPGQQAGHQPGDESKQSKHDDLSVGTGVGVEPSDLGFGDLAAPARSPM